MNSLKKKFDTKYKINDNAIIHSCTCTVPGKITIDPDSTSMMCGIVGVVDLENLKISMVGKVASIICVSCGKTVEIK